MGKNKKSKKRGKEKRIEANKPQDFTDLTPQKKKAGIYLVKQCMSFNPDSDNDRNLSHVHYEMGRLRFWIDEKSREIRSSLYNVESVQ